MVHRSADSRLLANLLQQEKDYSKQLGQVIESSNASLASFAAYAAASAPPTSHVIMDVAGALAAADEALRRYARGVDEWREAMRVLKDAEEEVGNIIRDREILVTRLIKASKPSKAGSGSIRESLLLSNQRFPSSSSLSLSVGGHAESPSPPPSRPLSGSFSSSTKLAAAQTELQACEAHLAAKERELVTKRNATIRDGMGARIRALVECGGTWTELGQSALRSLDELRIEQPEQRVLSIQDLRSPLSYIENNALSVPEGESGRPSSDFSSIGPSQSASQVNGHELPPPVSMAAVMNSVMFGTATAPGSTGEQTDANGGRPTHSHHSSVTGSSIFSNPAVPATYQVETVTYAPAIAVHVGGKEAAHETTDNFPTIPLPAPHALDGYIYDIPTAAAGPSGSQQPHSRSNSNSGHSTPQAAAFKPIIHTRHVLERRITEDSQEDRRRNSGALSDDVSSFDEVKQESQLLEEGKLALVENPRFLSESRRREIEKEKEKAKREEKERARKEKGKQRDGDDNPTREKKRFGLFHHSKPDQEHPQETRGAGPASVTGSPGDQGSPSKSFLGSIRGLFGAKPRTASSTQQSPSRHSRAARADDDSDHPADSDDEASPSKAPSRGLSLFRADKGKAVSQSQSQPGRWETRTNKNIQALARGSSFDGAEIARPAPSRLGGGIAGAAVAQAGVVNATSIGRRTRAASEDGTGTAGVGGTSAGKRLKKARGGAPAAAGSAVESNVSGASSGTVTQRTTSAVARAPAARGGERRSASLDVGENRKSWGEQTDEGEGDGMIVDLGRRRRVASEVGGTKAAAAAESAQRVASPASKKAPAPGVSKSASADVFGPTPSAKGYASDSTPAAQPSAGAGGVTKKKSLSKKRGQEPVPSATLQTASAPASTIGHVRAAAAATTPTRKPSTKTRSPLGHPTPSTSTSPTPTVHQAGGTTVLAAGGAQPSGVLVPQAGWNMQAHAQGGGLSRNNSVASVASAPAGGAAAARPKRKTTTLGQGVGGSGGVARRASLTHAPSPTKAEPTAVVPLAPAVSLMSIVEDVARTNREGWTQDLKTRKSVGGTQKATGMLDVVRAPPLMERSALEALGGPTLGRQRGSAAGSTASLALEGAAVTPSRTGMFEIKAPGSVFDQRKADAGGAPRAKPLVHTPPLQQQQQQYARASAPRAEAAHAAPNIHAYGKAPLRSAMRGSRSPSPAAGPSYTPYTPPPPPVNVAPQRGPVRKGPAAPEETDPSGDDASEVFYSDLEDFEAREAAAPKPVPRVSTLPPMLAPNGHAVNGYAGKTPSEMSHSSTSTFIAGAHGARPPVEYADSTPRRRKSVRVSLQPTFSPSPPALDYYEDQEQQMYAPWAMAPGGKAVAQQPRAEVPAPLPAPVATHAHAPRKPAADEPLDMWADSDDDEDEQYARAKRLLTRAAKKEKDMSLLASSRTH